MKPLAIRLNAQQDEVLDYTIRYGQFAAQRKFGVRDFRSFHNFLLGATGDEKFGYLPRGRQLLKCPHPHCGGSILENEYGELACYLCGRPPYRTRGKDNGNGSKG